MVRTQDLVTPGGGEVVDLCELVIVTLAPYRPAEGPERVTVDGPIIGIPKDKATALVMALHELATNAAKHGALSGAAGRVTVQWRVKPVSGAGELTVEWRECGGPPVSPPERRGFGSLAQDLVGTTELTFDPALPARLHSSSRERRLRLVGTNERLGTGVRKGFEAICPDGSLAVMSAPP